MKKIIIGLLISVVFLSGCKAKETKKLDYSKYLFTNVTWTRNSGHDIETLIFSADGSFTYYCACGNPVNDSDLCESYVYNDVTKEINLDCYETTEEMVTNIKIVEVSDEMLELDFNGEIRKFEIEK